MARIPTCPRCGSLQRLEPAARVCTACGHVEERPATPREHALQSAIDQQLRARSAESRALSTCDSCWTGVAPGVKRCDWCRVGAELAKKPEGERQRLLASVGLLTWRRPIAAPPGH